MKTLFIGGTGIISTACAHQAAEQGHELYLLNRGQSQRVAPASVKILHADIRDTAAVRRALGTHEFDVVVDFVAYHPDHIAADLATFKNRCGQYVFISSASAYQTPPKSLPVTENTPLDNPFWQYSRNKIACEQLLMKNYREAGFPVTIVRPSHTYDETSLPCHGGYTVVERMRRGKKIIVHGDGTSLWTLTHAKDFAKGFVPLLGNEKALGEVFHITSDEWLSWNRIFEMIAAAAGAEPQLVHIPSEFIAAHDPDWGASLLGDKAHSMIFDNSKIRHIVPDYHADIPFALGVKEIMAWHDENPARQIVNAEIDRKMDEIIENFDYMDQAR